MVSAGFSPRYVGLSDTGTNKFNGIFEMDLVFRMESDRRIRQKRFLLGTNCSRNCTGSSKETKEDQTQRFFARFQKGKSRTFEGTDAEKQKVLVGGSWSYREKTKPAKKNSA